ncbi:MAG: hypothetical protein H6667_17005 [Ardenticatenaceae bacterium]|nr:hypothetical protein [Ardenticatenaceae bacterium]MCB9443151.1 hypothetical protein [Ardenticatenaceae bacterium]
MAFLLDFDQMRLLKTILKKGTGLTVSLLLFMLSACSSGPAREWLNAPGWSHGLPLQETRIGDPVAMTLDDAGGMYLLFVTAVNNELSPKIMALNRQAELMWEQILPVTLSQPDKPVLLWHGQLLNLFWMASNHLFQAQVDTSGHILQEPHQLSGEEAVDTFDVALSPNKEITVWYAGPRHDPGIYFLPTGNLAGEAVLVDAEGIRPSIQYDSAGNLHTSWVHYPPGYSDTTYFYAVYADGVFEAGRETAVYQPALKLTDIMTGPWLALDNQKVYLVWNISVRTGPEAGKILTEFLTFPPGQPEQVSGRQAIIVPGIAEITYDYEPDGGLAAGKRVWPIDVYPTTTAVTDPAILTTNQPVLELAIAFDAIIQYEFRKERGQVGVIYLQDGQVNGYQLLSFTPNASVMPTIINDSAGNLYLTWLERAESGGFQIYFASTALDLIEALSGITTGDFSRITRETGFGLLSGAVLSPILVALWSLLPMIVLYATSILRRGQPGKRIMAGTVISLLLAIAAYWLVKLATIPGIRSYVPFSAWIPGIATWLQLPLQIIVPISTTLIGLATAWYFTYRRNSESIMNFLFIFTAVDGLLTMAVYGFQFYNVI